MPVVEVAAVEYASIITNPEPYHRRIRIAVCENRINTAYFYDGVGLAVNTVNQLYGLDIQDFIVIDISIIFAETKSVNFTAI